MGEPPLGTPTPEDRLDSWKEIAAYLNRDVTTVQRWEKREGMPVHRHLHDRMGSVYASRAELDAWTRSRNLRAAQENGNDAPRAESPVRCAAIARRSFSNQMEVRLGAGSGGSRCWRLAQALWFQKTEHFWRNPIADARFQTVTDFDGVEQAAAVSRDGHFVAFLSDRDGHTDVWVTQVGSGQFHNLTRGSAPELVNPSIRTLGFSPDGSLVTFWVRKQPGPSGDDISIWAVPTLGGQAEAIPRRRGRVRLVARRLPARVPYARTGRPAVRVGRHPATGGSAHLHRACRAPLSLSAVGARLAFIYFVQGSLPDKLDIWRIPPAGGTPERITSHNGRVSHPVFIGSADADVPRQRSRWFGTVALQHRRRAPHSSPADLWPGPVHVAGGQRRRPPSGCHARNSEENALALADRRFTRRGPQTPAQIPLTTSTGFSPRLGPNYLLYVSATGTSESIWKSADGTATELWSGQGAQVFGGPAISPDGGSIAFSVRQHGQTLLYVMQADGTNARVVADSLDLQGAPAWAPDGQSITSAAEITASHSSFECRSMAAPDFLSPRYSVDPAWAPDGRFVVYSGPDIGTTFSVKAVTAEAAAHPLPALTLTRGARHLIFLPEDETLVFLRGEIQHKNLWLIDLETGAERQLTNLAPDFDIRDFDISPDGREVVLERVQERSDVVLLDLSRP